MAYFTCLYHSVYVCVCVCVCVQYVWCLEHVARAVGITVAYDDLSLDEATQLIVDRARQLYDSISSQDKQSLIYTLQHKLRSVKERLDLKVINSRRKPLWPYAALVCRLWSPPP